MATRRKATKPARKPATEQTPPPGPELVIITGLSGSGKLSVLKALEDLGFYAVDHLPVELIGKFADLLSASPQIQRAALVVDIREGAGLKGFPSILQDVRSRIPTTLLYLEADQETLLRRFSETRRPHPLGTRQALIDSIHSERAQLEPIRAIADVTLNTTHFNVHELRDIITKRFGSSDTGPKIAIYVTSFGFRHGLPEDSDLVFDVRFLPNPNYIPKFKKLTGKNPAVAKYIRSFPQTVEFVQRISDLLVYLLPHYIREGKSYLTISFGCTGGHHRSVMMAEQIARNLKSGGYSVAVKHRDLGHPV